VAADFEVEDSAPPESEPLADGEVRLSLSFSGECWTEISDATGQRLFFEMGRAGETVELTGVAPFAALFGDVDNVSVRVDGNDYPVTTNNPGSRTARLTINQP
jgi:cytoskeleton protein RodZ